MGDCVSVCDQGVCERMSVCCCYVSVQVSVSACMRTWECVRVSGGCECVCTLRFRKTS